MTPKQQSQFCREMAESRALIRAAVRKPAAELAPPGERVKFWARDLIWKCREHERIAGMVNAPAWFIAPMSKLLDELESALDDWEGT